MNVPFYKHKYFSRILATAIALIAIAIYIFSGQSSINISTQALKNSPSVEDVQIVKTDLGQTTAKIKCKDGSNYDVYYPPGSTNYDALASGNCDN